MNKKDLWFVLIALGVVGLFIFLSLISRKAPPLSVRPEHASVTRDTRREDCWACHAPDSSPFPMSPRHPKKGKPPDTTTPCYVCHAYPDVKAASAFLMMPANTPAFGRFTRHGQTSQQGED
jgi:hypothetical protein